MSDKLLPCPCCGSSEVYDPRQRVGLRDTICLHCGVSASSAKAWNTRVLVCPDCGERLEKVAMYHQGYAYGVGEYAEPCKVGDEGYYNHNGLDQQCNAFIYVGCKCIPATCTTDDNVL